MVAHRRKAFRGGAAYVASASDFDGTNDYMRRGADLTGNADSKVGLVSVWFNLEGGNGANLGILTSYDTYFAIIRHNAGKMRITAKSSAGAQILYMDSTGTYASGGGWHHLLAAWNLASAVGQLYIDSADVRSASPTLTDSNIDYTRTEWHAGEGSYENAWNGCLAEIYLHVGTTLDISVQANREKFRSSGGTPVNLGADGSTPTGSQPIIYFKNAAASFGTNSGSGGNFTVGGTLDVCGSAP